MVKVISLVSRSLNKDLKEHVDYLKYQYGKEQHGRGHTIISFISKIVKIASFNVNSIRAKLKIVVE